MNTRIAQIFKDDKWQDIHPLEIKKNMVFRMFEGDGAPIGVGTTYIAKADAYDNHGVWTVETKVIVKDKKY